MNEPKKELTYRALSDMSDIAASAAAPHEPVTLTAPQGTVEVLPLGNGRSRVTLKPADQNLFIPRATADTSLPLDVIEDFMSVSYAWLCDSLARHDDPDYLRRVLENQIFAYASREDFKGKRLLDFGCGSGASTFSLAQMLPDTEVIGIELAEKNVRLARSVARARRLPNVSFEQSPDPNELPPGIGTFDYVMLSAVYEHLLPEERRRLMPLIWSAMKPGGMLFINQTPYGYFPYEHHSTGLWFINYMPRRLSHFMARHFSRKNAEINKSPDWSVHLRGGIRGATEDEIVRNLRRAGSGRPTIVQPRNMDRAAYWLSCTNPNRHRLLKRLVAGMFRITDKLWHTVPSMNVDVVIRKDPARTGK